MTAEPTSAWLSHPAFSPAHLGMPAAHRVSPCHTTIPQAARGSDPCTGSVILCARCVPVPSLTPIPLLQPMAPPGRPILVQGSTGFGRGQSWMVLSEHSLSGAASPKPRVVRKYMRSCCWLLGGGMAIATLLPPVPVFMSPGECCGCEQPKLLPLQGTHGLWVCGAFLPTARGAHSTHLQVMLTVHYQKHPHPLQKLPCRVPRALL